MRNNETDHLADVDRIADANIKASNAEAAKKALMNML